MSGATATFTNINTRFTTIEENITMNAALSDAHLPRIVLLETNSPETLPVATDIRIGNALRAPGSTTQLSVAIGYGALNSSTSGRDNVALGYSALNQCVNKDGNTAVGYYAMFMSNAE